MRFVQLQGSLNFLTVVEMHSLRRLFIMCSNKMKMFNFQLVSN